MSQKSRKAPFFSTLTAALAPFIGGCATSTPPQGNTEQNREVPTVDVVPFANRVSVSGNFGNQTMSGTANISQKRPIPLTDSRAVGLLAGIDGSASFGSYNRAEDQDVRASQYGGRIQLGIYGAGDGGRFISFLPTIGAQTARTDGAVTDRLTLNYGADVLAQTPVGNDHTFFRAQVGGSALDERSNYEQGNLTFDSRGRGYDLRAQVLQDLWANVNEDADGKKTLDQKVSLSLGGAYSQVNREITGQVNGQNLQIDENERRFGLNGGVLYFNHTHGFYVLLGGRGTFADISRDGNTSNSGDSSTSAGPLLEAGYNLRRLIDSDPKDDTWALFFKVQVGYNRNNRRDDEFYGAVGIDLADSIDLVGRAFGLKTN